MPSGIVTSQLNLTGFTCEPHAQRRPQLIAKDTAPEQAFKLPKFEFLAGRLSLDFCNSHSRATGRDRLLDPASLAAWAERAGWSLPERPSRVEFARALDLRDRLCRLFDALLSRTAPKQEDLDAIALAAMPAGAPKLRWMEAARRAYADDAARDLAHLHQAIAADAVSLLTGDATARLKRCPNDACHWFFLDTSRNSSRRWCAMADCGTRAKVRDYRARKQKH